MNIGSVSFTSPFFAAPMAGVVDLPMRILCRRFGAGLVYTEMVSAEAIRRGQKRTARMVTVDPREGPLAVQLFGTDGTAVARAAEFAQRRGAVLIDINMGCPVKKVIRQGAGAALMRDVTVAAGLVAAAKGAVDVPVTAKIRAGWNESSINYLDMAHRIRDAGADAICLHPRTATQHFTGRADWTRVAHLADSLDIPVVGSGDINSLDEARDRIKQTGVAFVMIGRGAMGAPWVFSESGAPRDRTELLDIILEHCRLAAEYYGESRCVPIIRRHVCYYIKGFRGAASFREHLMRTKRYDDMLTSIRDYLSHREEGDYATGSDGSRGEAGDYIQREG
ncbi:MAG: tRNA dihydrouridine synthase DusB [Deltaproteobacteria bacterium]|nr:tRNA dihydrouridine synthase DusB [Candidatus Zymogenaceae bacterium]